MNRKLRRMRRWARYVNHYSHIPMAACIGQGGFEAVMYDGEAYLQIRKQARHGTADDLTR